MTPLGTLGYKCMSDSTHQEPKNASHKCNGEFHFDWINGQNPMFDVVFRSKQKLKFKKSMFDISGLRFHTSVCEWIHW